MREVPPTVAALLGVRLRETGAETQSPLTARGVRERTVTVRPPARLANESALMTYRFTWISADGTRMEILWGKGDGSPLMCRGVAVREIRRPERFGWKEPKKCADFKRFAQAVADEWEAGYDDDELEELKAGRATA